MLCDSAEEVGMDVYRTTMLVALACDPNIITGVGDMDAEMDGPMWLAGQLV